MDDEHPSSRPSWLRTLGLVFAGWTLYAAVQASVILGIRTIDPLPDMPRPTYWNLFLFSLTDACLWRLVPGAASGTRVEVTIPARAVETGS